MTPLQTTACIVCYLLIGFLSTVYAIRWSMLPDDRVEWGVAYFLALCVWPVYWSVILVAYVVAYIVLASEMVAGAQK